MNTNTPTQSPALSWQAPRVANIDRGSGWYVTGGAVVLAGAVFGVLAGVWSLAIVCVLCGALYFLVRDHTFPDVTCALTDKGVQIGDTFLAWTQVKGYWFVITPSYTELRFTPKAPRTPDLFIQTGTLLPLDIRTFLAGKTDELTDKQERLVDILLRLTKL
jgi:hypothetical protein